MTKNKLIKLLQEHYSYKMANACINGKRKPSYEVMCSLNEKHKIPFTAWKDIKSYVTEIVTNTEKIEKV